MSPPAKKLKANPKFELSKNKIISISEFKNKTRIDIREYYEKDSELLPGKKGFFILIRHQSFY